LTLPALAGCLQMAAAVVSVNTGVMHLAALLGCRVVSLNGPTNAVRWGGWDRAATILTSRHQRAALS
jgi:ADP-heptose:LPS heptosyltransferase